MQELTQAPHPPREPLQHCFEKAQPDKEACERPSETRAIHQEVSNTYHSTGRPPPDRRGENQKGRK